MTTEEKTRRLAELDGWVIIGDNAKHPILTLGKWTYKGRTAPDYTGSYDAIIPLIQKQEVEVQWKLAGKLMGCAGSFEQVAACMFRYTPEGLCDALLAATGKDK